jgi:ornithine cyclodeaminase/alanine dehydrogenase-like protein (mu-crystallin family)
VSTANRQPVRLLTRSQVRDLLGWPGLIEAVAAALTATLGDGGAVADSAQLRVPGAALHLKSGAIFDPALLSVKANIRPDAGSADGLIVAFDPVGFAVRAVLDSAALTGMRTAAVAAVAARALAAPGPNEVAVIGTGPVGRNAITALAQTIEVSGVRLWSRGAGAAEDAAAHAVGLGIPATVCGTPSEAADGAPVVLTATPARAPVLAAGSVRADAVILAMGADTAGKRELGPGLLDDADLVADSPADALTVGELGYLPAGRDPAEIVPLGRILTGQRPAGRGRRVVFDSVGSAVVDAACVELVLSAAAERGIGESFDFGR